MSTLQLAMIAAGVVLVLAVIAYNVWQERRVRRRIASAFNPPPPPAAPDAERARRIEPTLGARDDALSPRAEARGAPREALAPSGGAFAIPMDDVTVAAGGEAAALEDAGADVEGAAHDADVEPDAAQEPAAATWTSSAQPDPDIECMVMLAPVEPLRVALLSTGLSARLGKTLRWFGRAQPGGAWELLSPDSPGRYHEVCAGLLLADRNGAVSQAQLHAYLRLVGELGAAVGANVDAPDAADELARAQALDRLCADLDVQIGLTLLKPDPGTVPGTRLRGVAEAAGFRLAQGGRFELLSEDTGTVLYTLHNVRSDPFTVESLRLTSTNGVVFVLDVPRVPDPARVFDQMKLAARRMAHTLGAELVDDNRRALDDAALAKIRAQVQAAADALSEVHIEPGSARAMALFGA